MEISQFLSPASVKTGIKTSSKKRLLQHLAEQAHGLLDLPEQDIFDALLEREKLGPTGMGGGVAIPHARLEGLSQVQGLFMTLGKPVDFEAIDDRPVDILFALFAPVNAGAEHLRALARVSRTLRDDQICNKLRSTDDAAAVYAILTEQDVMAA